MSDATPRLGLPDLTGVPELFPEKVSDAFWQLDAVTDLYLKGRFVDDPPGSADDGDVYLVGGTPSPDWGEDDFTWKLALRRDGAWCPLAPFNGLRGFVEGENRFIVHQDGAWRDANALVGAAETSIASAATCDVGAADGLFVAVTGTTAITSLGTTANCLRLLRFAGALTLTHNATSLILPGAANIATAAGDTAIVSSDGSGNWRCRLYSRASGIPIAAANSVTGSGSLVLSASPALTTPAIAGAVTITGAADVRQLVIKANASQTNPVLSWQDSSGSNKLWVDASFNLVFNGTNRGFFSNGSSDSLVISSGSSASVIFKKGSTENGRTGADGSLLWGTATDGGWTGGARAEFKGSGNVLSAWCTSTGANSTLLIRNDNAASAPVTINFNGSANIGGVSITGGGTGVAWNTTSDARLKEVLTQQGDYRRAIRALWVGDFAWKKTGVHAFGVLAQQAWDVMPWHMGVTRPADEKDAWQASAEPFAHLALWGVKDLYALVEALAVRVAALEEARDAAG